MFNLKDFPITNKTVLIRVDYNVPLKNGKVLDAWKIKASLPTIHYLLNKNCKIILATHLGRPDGKIIDELKTDILAKELKKLLPKEKITKLDDCIGRDISYKIKSGSGIFLLENLRFYKQEKQNNPVFAHSLAFLADVYINNAFGDSHRKHASIDAITKYLPAIPGLLINNEVKYLKHALSSKEKALWILGGGKLDKINLVKLALKKAEYVLIGGALIFPFLKAQGFLVGMSKVDANSVKIAKKILKGKNSKKIILPIDFVVSNKISANSKTKIVKRISNGEIGLDIGPESIKMFKSYLRKVHTIIWNGPLGYYELAKFSNGTKEIARYLGLLTATSIAGGGETSQAIRTFHLEEDITHMSTGGGAFLDYLTGEKLPGLVALENNYKKFKRKIKT